MRLHAYTASRNSITSCVLSNSNGGGISQGYNCCNYSSHRKALENPKYGNE